MIQLAGSTLLTAAAMVATRAAEPIRADVALVSGRLVDGTGGAIREGDVLIAGDKIILPGKNDSFTATWTIDCSGLVICPGFIDLHNHSDTEIGEPETRAAANFVTQGCTTMVTGNCGSGPVDVASYYQGIDDQGAGTNIAHLIPQGSLREQVLDSARVEPNDAQMEAMKKLAEEGMCAGAWGMSTGLIYVPSSFASTAEITEIARIVASHGGIYASHIRGEGIELLDAVNEALQIGRDAGLPVHISHFKSSGRESWGLVRQAAQLIEAQRKAGLVITADQYPYTASSTSLSATVLPSWAREGNHDDLCRRLDEQSEQMRELIADHVARADAGRAIRIATYAPKGNWVGKDLATIAESEGRPVTEIVVEMLKSGETNVVKFGMSEEDVRHVMAIDWVATASDGGAKLPGASMPHPRNYGTFPRKLGYYCLQEKILPLEQAVRSMTGLPAEILSMPERGLLRDGFAADITVFDPSTLRDTATFDHPHRYAEGIEYVFVNGKPAVVQGKYTGALAGKALRFQPFQSLRPSP
jgi:N-acyl-D-aspartate/D-glutamate deacylase